MLPGSTTRHRPGRTTSHRRRKGTWQPTAIVIVGGGLAGATAAEESARARTTTARSTCSRPSSTTRTSGRRCRRSYVLGKDGRGQRLRASERLVPRARHRRHDRRARRRASATTSSRLAGGREVPFDRLLLATGATPRRLDVPGADAPGIHYLRTLDDSEALRDAIDGRRAAGRRRRLAGWIGLELAAAAARSYGNDVTVVAPGRDPARRARSATELGTMFRELHEQNGVDLPARDECASLRTGGGRGQRGRDRRRRDPGRSRDRRHRCGSRCRARRGGGSQIADLGTAAASSSTSTSRRALRMCSPPATSPTRIIP